MSKVALLLYCLFSLFFCLRRLPRRQAIHVPILIHPSVRVKGMPRGCIVFKVPIRHGMFIFGFDGTIGQSNCKSLISIKNGGRLEVGNIVNMARGTRLVIDGGVVSIGSHFWCNGDSFFNCTTRITIGDDNMYGWDISFNTSDGHYVYDNGNQKPMEGDITIGNHVWIGSHCIIGKNTQVADDCVVAQHSLLSKTYDKAKCLIVGMPAKILKENFTWTEKDLKDDV